MLEPEIQTTLEGTGASMYCDNLNRSLLTVMLVAGLACSAGVSGSFSVDGGAGGSGRGGAAGTTASGGSAGLGGGGGVSSTGGSAGGDADAGSGGAGAGGSGMAAGGSGGTFVGMKPPGMAQTGDITINPSTTYQTMDGFG